MDQAFSAAMLPVDLMDATLAGRLLLAEGPTPVLVRDGRVEDVSAEAATISDLLELDDPRSVPGRPVYSVDELCDLPAAQFLAPIDLQLIKAAGVTFAVSAIERVIEERARGDMRRPRRSAASSSNGSAARSARSCREPRKPRSSSRR